MKKRKFPVKPNKCLSTHGGAGYALGSFWDNGSIVCGACGTKIENPTPTRGYNGTSTYPSWIGGIPAVKTSNGLRMMELSKKKWWEFWK